MSYNYNTYVLVFAQTASAQATTVLCTVIGLVIIKTSKTVIIIKPTNMQLNHLSEVGPVVYLCMCTPHI